MPREDRKNITTVLTGHCSMSGTAKDLLATRRSAASCGRPVFLSKRRTGNLQLMVRSQLQRLESFGIPAAPE